MKQLLDSVFPLIEQGKMEKAKEVIRSIWGNENTEFIFMSALKLYKEHVDCSIITSETYQKEEHGS